jgi:hypothetical protein
VPVQRPGVQWVQRPGAPVQRPGAQVQRPGVRWGRRPYQPWQWWSGGYYEPTWDVEPEPSAQAAPAARVDVPGYGPGYGPTMSGRWIRRGRKIIVFGA